MSAASHKVYQYGSTDIPIPSTISGQNINESYLQWKNFSPIVLSNTVATQFPDCPCGNVTVHNPLGQDVIFVGGSGPSDLPYLIPNNPGLGRGTPVHPGLTRVFKVTNMNLLAAIAVRNGDIIDPQAALSQTDFTTPTDDPAANPSALPPLTVTSTTPTNGATLVLTDQVVQMVFNRPLNAASVTSANVTISPATGTTTVAVDGTNPNQIDLNPNGSNFVSGTTYTVTLTTNIQDTFGLALLSPVVFSFTVGNVPTVISVNPGNNATNVLVNSSVQVVMNEMVQSASVNSTNCQIIQVSNSAVVTSNVTLGVDGVTITIAPTSNLSFSTQYKVVIKNVKNGGGSVTQSPNPWDGASVGPGTGEFTTAAPLTVSTVSPGASSTTIEVNTAVTVVMSATVQSAGVTTSNCQIIQISNGSVVTSTVGLGGDNKTITITPSANLSFSTAYKVVISNLTTLVGGITQSPSPWDGVTQSNIGKFTTLAALTVSTCSPGANATNVAENTAVTVVMNQNVKNSTVTTGNCQIIKVSNSAVVTSAVALGGDQKTITITPSANLANSTQYKVVIQNLQDLAGVVQSPTTWDGATVGPGTGEFTTIAVLTVSSVVPGSNATSVSIGTTVVITMNQAFQPAGVTNANVKLVNVGTGSTVTTTSAISGANTVVTLTPSSNLTDGVQYKVIVQNLLDVAGVTMSPSPWDGASQGPGNGEFTTTAIPNVSSVSPGSASTGVAVNTNVVITMNTAVQPGNATTSNVQLFVVGGAQITCSLALSGGNTILTLDPNVNLLNNTEYKVIVQNQTNVDGVTQSPNPWDGVSQGPNSGAFTTKDFTSRYNVSQTASPCGNSATNGWMPFNGGTLCGSSSGGLGTCSDNLAPACGEIASVANGLTAAPITKVTIVALSGTANDYNNNSSAPTGTFSIKIISGTTVQYTFSQTFVSTSTGYNNICQVVCGGGGGEIQGWTTITFTDQANTYTMAVGDAIVVSWSGTCQNSALVSANSGGSPNKGCYTDSSNHINSLSDQDFAAQMWSSL
jgi:Bacterial Ig-like domain